MEEKAKAVKKGTFEDLIKQRKKNPKYAQRVVTIHVRMETNTLEYHIIDEGDGFDHQKEFDPDPHRHIGSGLGVQIAKTFFHEVRYEGNGNRVRLIYRKEKGCRAEQESPSPIIRDDFIIQLTRSFPSGLLVVSDKKQVILWNKTAQKITSVKSSEVLGKPINSLPEIVKNLLSPKDKLLTIEMGEFDLRYLEKTMHTVEPKEGGKFTVVLFSDVPDHIRQKDEMERLLMESAETRDLMEEQAPSLTITLAYG